MRRRLPDIPRLEAFAWLGLVAAALAVRLIDLGSRSYHHDESQIAYFSWVFAERGEYEYNPLLHSPGQYYLVALTYKLLGDGDFTARLPAALAGTVLVALAFGLRRYLGRVGAYAAGVGLAFTPSFLYYSRFIREDIFLAAVNLALIVALSYFLSRPKRWHPALLGALVALAFGIKEATFITLGIAGPFFVVWYLAARRAADPVHRPLREHPLVRAVTGVGWEAWGWGLATFLALYTLIFTTFLTDPQHWDALYEGLAYWREQHGAGRGEKEQYFYSVVLATTEWPALVLGAIGAGAMLRRRTPFGLFLIWLFVGQLVAYSIANERFSWLVLHPLLPLVLLAGAGVQVVWDARRRAVGWLAAGLVLACAAYTGYATFQANAVNHTDPREFLVTTQSAPEVHDVVDRVRAEAASIRREEGRPARVVVDSAQGQTFPYAWYFRDLEGVGYLDLSKVQEPPEADVILMSEASFPRLQDVLGDFRAEQVGFRVWWVRDYGALDLASYADWVLKREPWSPTGGLTSRLLIRR